MTSVLITGGGGFAGGHVREACARRGWATTVLDQRAAPGVIVADLRAPDAVLRAVEEADPDLTIHLAGSDGRGPEADVMAVNAGGTLNLVRALTAIDGPRRLVVAGSSAQYGGPVPEDLPMPEEARLAPAGIYGQSKIVAEAIALSASRAGALEVVAARPFNHTGPGEPLTRACPAFASQIARVERGRQDEVVVGNLEAVRDISDVRDIAEGYLALGERGTPGRIYNLCSGRGVEISEVLEILCSLAEKPIKVREDESRMQAGDVPVQIGSYERARDETGWSPQRRLEDTLQDLLDDCRNRGEQSA